MSAPVGPDSVPSPRFEVRVRRIRGSVTASRDGESYELSDVAAFVFRQVDGERSVAAIAGLVATEYDIDPGEALEDTVELLGQLAELDLIGLQEATAR